MKTIETRKDQEINSKHNKNTKKEIYNEIEDKGLKNQNFILETIFLLYKKKEKTKIENYRPITLTNTNYKILTKTIATKLEKLVHKIIHSNQARFISKRGLYDHTRMTEAMINYCDTYKEDSFIMALDQEKAYDKIAYDYLWKILEQFKNLYSESKNYIRIQEQ